MTKQCAACGDVKERSEFVSSKSRKDGLHPYCKPCHRAKSRSWVLANREKRLAIVQKYDEAHREEKNDASRRRYHANLEQERRRSAEYRIANPHKSLERSRRWNIENRGRRNAVTAKRRAQRKRAQPIWADVTEIERLYRVADGLSKWTGIQHEVDHIVPLQHPRVCGLHTPDNLRVLTMAENRAKSNKLLASEIR